MIKTVIFDIGNVLLYYSHEKMTLQLSEELQVPFYEVEKKLKKEKLIHDYESGNLSTDQIMHLLQSLSDKTLKREIILHAMSSIFTENHDIMPIVQSLKRQNKKLLLLSNTNEAHFQYIKNHFPWVSLFDAAILSYEVKGAKPDPSIYQAALKVADCSPHECFYIDDVSSHITAAKQLGIDAEIFENVEKLRFQLAKRMVFV